VAVELPWGDNKTPLILAPMQGLTNRPVRKIFISKVQPDVVFTEFLRVRSKRGQEIHPRDLKEISINDGAPLVVQLIGRHTETLVNAAKTAIDVGAVHFNLNLGCPFGRMSTTTAGGALMQTPEEIFPLLKALRKVTPATLSVKIRAGFANTSQIGEILPQLENTGIDFLVLHPRSVLQKYAGEADHRITGEMVTQASIPIIANGDINARNGLQILQSTGATGLMLGRGAIGDPWLFKRLRGELPLEEDRSIRISQLTNYLQELLAAYEDLFCGQKQILDRIKEVLFHIPEPWLQKDLAILKKMRSIDSFQHKLKEMTA